MVATSETDNLKLSVGQPAESAPSLRESEEISVNQNEHPMLHLTDEDLELKRLMYGDDASRSPVSQQSSQVQAEESLEQQQQQQESHGLQVLQQPPVPAQSPSSSSGKTDGESLASEERPAKLEPVELRLLVRRREAGALIGRRGANIKRLRETFRHSMFSIPDTGNGPERIVCIVTNDKSLDAILADITQLFVEKSPENDEQIELKLLIHSSHAGSIIGLGGQSIKKLRNVSSAFLLVPPI